MIIRVERLLMLGDWSALSQTVKMGLQNAASVAGSAVSLTHDNEALVNVTNDSQSGLSFVQGALSRSAVPANDIAVAGDNVQGDHTSRSMVESENVSALRLRILELEQSISANKAQADSEKASILSKAKERFEILKEKIISLTTERDQLQESLKGMENKDTYTTLLTENIKKLQHANDELISVMESHANPEVSNYLQSERVIIEDLLKKIVSNNQKFTNIRDTEATELHVHGDSQQLLPKYRELEEEVHSLRLKLRELLDCKATETSCTLCANLKIEIEELKTQHTSETQALLAKMKEKFDSMKSMLKDISEERDRLLENAESEKIQEADAQVVEDLKAQHAAEMAKVMAKMKEKFEIYKEKMSDLMEEKNRLEAENETLKAEKGNNIASGGLVDESMNAEIITILKQQLIALSDERDRQVGEMNEEKDDLIKDSEQLKMKLEEFSTVVGEQSVKLVGMEVSLKEKDSLIQELEDMLIEKEEEILKIQQSTNVDSEQSLQTQRENEMLVASLREKAELEVRVSELQEALQKAEESSQQTINAQIKELHTLIERLMLDNENLTVHLETTTKSNNEEKSQFLAQLEQMKYENSILISRVETLTSNLENLSNEVSPSSDDFAAKLNALESENAELKEMTHIMTCTFDEEKAELEAVVEKLNNEISTLLSSNHKTNEAKISESTVLISELRESLSEKESKISLLESQLSSSIESIDTLSTELKSSTSSMIVLQSQNDNLTKEIEEIKSLLETANNTISEQQNIISRLEIQMETMNQEISELKSTIDFLDSEKQKLEMASANDSQQQSSDEEFAAQLAAERQRFEEEKKAILMKAKEKFEAFKTQMISLSEDLKNTQEEKDGLVSQLDEVQHSNLNLLQTIQQLKTDLESQLKQSAVESLLKNEDQLPSTSRQEQEEQQGRYEEEINHLKHVITDLEAQLDLQTEATAQAIASVFVSHTQEEKNDSPSSEQDRDGAAVIQEESKAVAVPTSAENHSGDLIRRADEKVKTLEQAVEAYKKHVIELQCQLESLNQKNSSASASVSGGNGPVTQCSDCQSLQEAVDALSEEKGLIIAKAKERFEKIKEQMTALANERNELFAEKEGREKQVFELKMEVQQLRMKQEQEGENVKGDEDRNVESNALYKALLSQVQTLEKEKDVLQKEFHSLVESKNKSEAELSAEITTLKVEIDKLKAAYSKLQELSAQTASEEQQKLQAKINLLEEELESVRVTAGNEKQAMLAKARERFEAMKTQLLSSNEEREQQMQTIATLQEGKDELASQVRQLSSESQKEKQSFNSKLAALESEKSRLTDVLSHAKIALDRFINPPSADQLFALIDSNKADKETLLKVNLNENIQSQLFGDGNFSQPEIQWICLNLPMQSDEESPSSCGDDLVDAAMRQAVHRWWKKEQLDIDGLVQGGVVLPACLGAKISEKIKEIQFQEETKVQEANNSKVAAEVKLTEVSQQFAAYKVKVQSVVRSAVTGDEESAAAKQELMEVKAQFEAANRRLSSIQQQNSDFIIKEANLSQEVKAAKTALAKVEGDLKALNEFVEKLKTAHNDTERSLQNELLEAKTEIARLSRLGLNKLSIPLNPNSGLPSSGNNNPLVRSSQSVSSANVNLSPHPLTIPSPFSILNNSGEPEQSKIASLEDTIRHLRAQLASLQHVGSSGGRKQQFSSSPRQQGVDADEHDDDTGHSRVSGADDLEDGVPNDDEDGDGFFESFAAGTLGNNKNAWSRSAVQKGVSQVNNGNVQSTAGGATPTHLLQPGGSGGLASTSSFANNEGNFTSDIHDDSQALLLSQGSLWDSVRRITREKKNLEGRLNEARQEIELLKSQMVISLNAVQNSNRPASVPTFGTPPVGGSATAVVPPNNVEYLCNIVLKFIECCPDGSAECESLVKVLMSILKVSDVEQSKILSNRKQRNLSGLNTNSQSVGKSVFSGLFGR
eukprot:GDKJ01024479.1.p1 GENE.GDKJ01024479.1~~GDKJ01024479.1.p1  ORF type:complete len:1940 (-),score=574.97 GDKJ01024479.1:324-6143(-)